MQFCFMCLLFLREYEAAKILAVFATPSISHQVVFRPFTQELARRNHEVTVLTTDPCGKKLDNFTEIDIHDLFYNVLKNHVSKLNIGRGVSMYEQFEAILNGLNDIGDTFFKSEFFCGLNNKKYDLIIVDAFIKVVLPISHILQAPVVQISSFGSMFDYETFGAPSHPLLYPEFITQRMKNLTILEKYHEILVNTVIKSSVYRIEEKFDALISTILPGLPSVYNLRKGVLSSLLNVQAIWEENRPVPIGVSYIGGIRRNTMQNMSQELQNYLYYSRHGVIYVSFGTNVPTSLIPKNKINVILNVLAKLPQDILLKWDSDELPGKPKNIKIAKWFPQIAILRHPKVKLFITQCGLQSTEEAIEAGVPLIGIPFVFDQWNNAEKYVRHKIGVKLEIETLTENKFKSAIDTVIGDESYRKNIIMFRTLLWDQRLDPLELAVRWTEYCLKYGGVVLRSPAADVSWVQYFELELLCIILFIVCLIFCISNILLRRLIYLYRKNKLD